MMKLTWLQSLGITFIVGAVIIAISIPLNDSSLAIVGISLPIWNVLLYVIYLILKDKNLTKG